MQLFGLMKYTNVIVGTTWVLGLLELYLQITPIPTQWLLIIALFSLIIHAVQAAYFTVRFGDTAKPLLPHVLRILIFGMPYIVNYRQRLE